MTRKQLLDTARGLSLKYAKQMHAWGVAMLDGETYLALYVYKGPLNVEMSMVSQLQSGIDADEARLLVDHLNEVRGLGHEGVRTFVTAYEAGRAGAKLLARHLYP